MKTWKFKYYEEAEQRQKRIREMYGFTPPIRSARNELWKIQIPSRLTRVDKPSQSFLKANPDIARFYAKKK